MLSIVYIVLFVYFDSKELSIASLKKSVNNFLSSDLNGQAIKIGPDTYQINFRSTKEKEGDGIQEGTIINGNNSYSNGFDINIREIFKDTLTIIKTQAKFKRLKTDSLNVLFVITIETPGIQKPYWNASYGLNHEFKKDSLSVLNGRLKVDGYPITEKSKLKGYIWNIGKSEILLSSISITFGTDPTSKGDTTLIKQMEGEVLVAQNGFQPYLPKKLLEPKTNNPIANFSQLGMMSNIATLGNTIIQTGFQYCFTYNSETTSIKKIKLVELDSIAYSPIFLNSQLCVTPQHVKGKTVYAYKLSNDTTDRVKFEFPAFDEWIISHCAASLNEDQPIWINKSGTMIYCPGKLDNAGICKVTGIEKKDFVQSIVYLGNQQYLLFVQGSNLNCKVLFGVRKQEFIHFSPLKYPNQWTKKVLSFSENDQLFRTNFNTYLVFGRGWRYSINKIQIDNNGSVQILESWFPKGKNGESPPFYFEHLEAAYLYKSGELILSAAQNSSKSMRNRVNKTVVNTYIVK